MIRLYVASSFEARLETRALMARLRAAGFEITHDWTFEDDVGLTGKELLAYREKCGKEDLLGVLSADALVFVPPGGRGAFFELGVAAGQGLPVVMFGDHGPEEKLPLFLNLVKMRTADFTELVRHLKAAVPACVRCGCTERNPCLDDNGHGEPCWWTSDEPRCSMCPPLIVAPGGGQ